MRRQKYQTSIHMKIFHLNFKNEEQPGRIRITEPMQADAGMVITNEREGYGMNISFASETTDIKFIRGFFDPAEQEQVLPDGTVVMEMTMGFEWLELYSKKYGWNADIEFEVEEGSTFKTVGALDFIGAEISKDAIKCKVVQNTERAKIKRRETTQIDVYSNKDISGKPIDPLQPIKMLLKAKPVTGVSVWEQRQSYLLLAGGSIYFNLATYLTTVGIEDSLVPFEALGGFGDAQAAGRQFKYIRAQTNLTNVKIHFDLDIDFFYRVSFPASTDQSECFIRVYALCSLDPYELTPDSAIWNQEIYKKSLYGRTNQNFHLPDTLDANLPDCPKDYCISIIWALSWDTEHLGETDSSGYNFGEFLTVLLSSGVSVIFQDVSNGTTLNTRTSWSVQKSTFQITATQTAFDSVISGVRYGDLFKQAVKSINGQTVSIPEFEPGGRYYDQIAFNGYGIRQFTDKPFLIDFKKIYDDLKEVNFWYQLANSGVKIQHYDDFFRSYDMGGFLQAYPVDFTEIKDDEYAVNTFEFGYSTYEQGDNERNTTDAIHTDQQKSLPSDKVPNTKQIELNIIRDPFAGEKARRDGVNTKNTTSLENDTKIFVYDIVPLPPGTYRKYGLNLLARKSNGRLELLNTSTDSNSTSFGWDTIGVTVGGNFEIFSNAANGGLFQIISITPTTLVLQPTSPVSIVDYEGYVVFGFTITGVSFMNRTDEEMIVENIQNGDNFGNLLHSPRRNIIEWESWLAAAAMYDPTGIIRTTSFKNNGLARTKFRNERFYQENEEIPVSSLKTAVLRPELINTTVSATLQEVVELERLQETEFGFIRVQTLNGTEKIFIKKSEYNIRGGFLKITGWRKNEPDFIAIERSGEFVLINGTPYGEFRFNVSEYGLVSLFDVKNILLNKPQPYQKVTINGNTYTNVVDFVAALENV